MKTHDEVIQDFSCYLLKAQQLLTKACDQLYQATGLEISADFLSHALRNPELSIQISAQIDLACRSISDPNKMMLAKEAIDDIFTSISELRIALTLIAASQTQHSKAISAYNQNL